MFFRKQKSVGNDNRPVPAQPTFIGADTRFDGNIDTDGELHIEGEVRGSVRAGVCIIATSGIVEGEVIAGDVIVHGRVDGPLRATHVHLQPGATVEGDITSETIAIETGARLSGAVWQSARDQQPRQRAALGYGESSHLFSDSLWSSQEDDPMRPLKAVKPRAANGSRG